MNVYQRFEALSPVYRGGLTNHLPMLYSVYKKLELDEDIIIQKLTEYRDDKGILDLTSPGTPVLAFEQDYVKLTGFFLKEMNEKGKNEVIKDYLNKRIKALHSALYHGLIRLYYSIEMDNDLMIAQALAYYELVNKPFRPSRTKYGQMDYHVKFHELLQKVRDAEIEFPHQSTMSKFDTIANHKLFGTSVINLNYNDISELYVLELILERYNKTADFYVLHLITGFHALHGLKKYFVDYQEVLRYYLDSAIIFMMMAPYDETFDVPDEPIEYYINDIVAFKDAHTVKLLYSLYDLHQDFPLHSLVTAANIVTTKQP